MWVCFTHSFQYHGECSVRFHLIWEKKVYNQVFNFTFLISVADTFVWLATSQVQPPHWSGEWHLDPVPIFIKAVFPGTEVPRNKIVGRQHRCIKPPTLHPTSRKLDLSTYFLCIRLTGSVLIWWDTVLKIRRSRDRLTFRVGKIGIPRLYLVIILEIRLSNRLTFKMGTPYLERRS